MKKSQFVSMLMGWSVVSASAQTLELFFLAGQSNADGSNSYYTSGNPGKGDGLNAGNAFYGNPYSGVVYSYAHVNPFSGTPDRYLTGNWGTLRPATWGMMGPELSLGRELDTMFSHDVGIIKYTAPGTSLATQWGPDDHLLYQDMVNFFTTRIAELSGMYSEIRLNTFFWHQGESDSGVNYAANFSAMLSQLRLDLGAPELNSVMGLISENFDPGNTGVTPRSNVVAVNQEITNLANADPRIATTGSLTDIPLHDYVHFDANGQIIHGQRMADSFAQNFLVVPEPSAVILLITAGIGCLQRRRETR
jgi:hypothetical protein